MRISAIEKLVCPDTLKPLRLDTVEVHDGEVVEGILRSDGGAHPIRHGIPSFVSNDVMEDQTVQSFAQKWKRHKYYRTHTARFYTDWYLQRYGFFELPKLRRFLGEMAFILDAGTGSGRDAANLAEHSPATVFAVDTAWEALTVAGREVNHPRVGFVHADINRLPFPDEFFDFINCDQVIHHTVNPRGTFEYLSRKLRPAGRICCYVYRKKAVIREFVDDYVRERITGLPFDEALKVCDGITRLGRTLSNLRATVEIEEDIPILGITKGRIDLQRFLHWNVMKCFWNDEFDFFTNNVINVDWYHPEHCHRFEPDEFRAWFAHGWRIEAWDVEEAGISCRARKV